MSWGFVGTFGDVPGILGKTKGGTAFGAAPPGAPSSQTSPKVPTTSPKIPTTIPTASLKSLDFALSRPRHHTLTHPTHSTHLAPYYSPPLTHALRSLHSLSSLHSLHSLHPHRTPSRVATGTSALKGPKLLISAKAAQPRYGWVGV